ncbi:MAG: DUF2818 family protein [Betaproteobacteria bacterium]|nr:DUF2818 family protein [Betaproteobacteria bacterium]
MNPILGTSVLLILSLLLANLPFFSERLFGLVSLKSSKGLGIRLLEVAVAYVLLGLLARLLESHLHGSVYAQGWEFYAITVALFIVLAYPGFVWRYLWRRRSLRP